ncbi:MAG: hypothetical protein ABIH88_02130 [Patescibacteria group bacterium]
MKKLNFSIQPQKGTSHIKFRIPSDRKTPPGARSFIVVQLGRKSFHPHARSRYISQIKQLGFAKKEILDNL